MPFDGHSRREQNAYAGLFENGNTKSGMAGKKREIRSLVSINRLKYAAFRMKVC